MNGARDRLYVDRRLAEINNEANEATEANAGGEAPMSYWKEIRRAARQVERLEKAAAPSDENKGE